MNNMQNSIRIKVELPLEQYNAFIKNMDINNIKIDYNIYDYPVININIPNLPSIHVDIINVKVPLPSNEEISAELCTPKECLSTGRGLFSKDVLDQIIKADDTTTFMWKLVETIKSGIGSSFYKVHIGVKAFELIKQFLVEYEDKTDNSIYYLSELSEIKNTKFVIDNKIEPDLAIIKHNYNKEKL